MYHVISSNPAFKRHLTMPLLWLILFSYAYLALLEAQKQTLELPNYIQPKKYNLSLETHYNKQHPKGIFKGRVQIELMVLKETRQITLNAHELQIDPQIWLIRRNTKRRITLNRTASNPKLQQLSLHFNNQLWLGEHYTLQIDFSSKLGTEANGYYRRNYVDRENMMRWLTMTHFEPNKARQVFPCFDDPQFKSLYTIQLAHPSELHALSNMPVVQRLKHQGLPNYVWTYFAESILMPTYLVGFTLNRFLNHTHKRDKLPAFTTWMQPGAAEQSQYTIEISSKLLDYYAQLFAYAYPLPKIDQLILPDIAFVGNTAWGLICHKESAFVYDAQYSMLKSKQELAHNMAMQFVHQWFGILVSTMDWREAWFKDGIASYLAGFGLEEIEPAWRYHEQYMLQQMFDMLQQDSRLNTNALDNINNEAYTKWHELELFSQRKSAVFLRMLHHVLGSKVFLKSLRLYLTVNAHDTASPQALWSIFQSESKKELSVRQDIDLMPFIGSWSQQQGFPLIHVARNYTQNSAFITQTRFLRTAQNESAAQNSKQRCWWVPLSYTNREEADFAHSMPKAWLKCDKKNAHAKLHLKSLSQPEDWVIFNIRLAAPYRVNYDALNWLLIKQALDNGELNSIDKLNRAQIVDDALNLAWSDILSYKTALSMLEFLRREQEYVVWKAALQNLSQIDNLLKRTTDEKVFKDYMRQLLKPKFDEFYANYNQSNSQTSEATPLMRIVLQLACIYELESCTKMAVERFAALDPLNNTIHVDVREAIYCTAIRRGTEDDWLLVRKLYQSSHMPGEQIYLLSALGCSRETWALEKVLRWAFSGKNMRLERAQRTFKAVVRNPVGSLVAQKYLATHIQSILKFCNNSTTLLGRIISPLLEEFSSEVDLKFIRKLFEENLKELHGMEITLKRLVELVQDNIHWRKNVYIDFLEALREIEEDSHQSRES